MAPTSIFMYFFFNFSFEFCLVSLLDESHDSVVAPSYYSQLNCIIFIYICNFLTFGIIGWIGSQIIVVRTEQWQTTLSQMK